MVWKSTRRSVLALAASLAALGLGFKSKAATPPRGADPQSGSPLPAPAAAPFDTVVVLMMENRSFDHVLGWLPGANGRQGGLSYLDKDGVALETWPLGPDFRAAPTKIRTTPGPALPSGMLTGAATVSYRPPRSATDFPSAITARTSCRF
jgi:phospholipase C